MKDDIVIPKPVLKRTVPHAGVKLKIYQDIDGDAFCEDDQGNRIARASLYSQAEVLGKWHINNRIKQREARKKI